MKTFFLVFFSINFIFSSCFQIDKRKFDGQSIDQNMFPIDSIILSKELKNDLDCFISKTDSIDSIMIMEGYNVYTKNVIWLFFYIDDNKNLLEMSRLAFYSKSLSEIVSSFGYSLYKNKLLIFYFDDVDQKLINIKYLNNKLPEDFPNENSLEAIQTNHGGNYKYLKYLIESQDQIFLISQNPLHLIR